MIYRKIKKEEAKEFANLSAIAFHTIAKEAYEDIEKGEFLEDTVRIIEDENGKFIAGLRLFDLKMQLDGQYIRCGGIGDVSSYPEHRRHGNISRLFDEVLKEMYDDNFMISYLYPFSHSFYRKYGYELCRDNKIVSFETKHIPYCKDKGYIRQHIPNTENDLSEDIKKIYGIFAEKRNFMVEREGWFWDRILKSDAYTSSSRLYVCYTDDNTPAAYVLYEAEKKEPYMLKANIMDKAWINRNAFDMWLRFIYRLAPAVCETGFSCPSDFEVMDIIEEPYELKVKSEPGGMLRIVNVKRALEVIKKPELGIQVSIKVKDDNIPENNGIFLIKGDTVRKDESTKEADLECSVHVLAQLISGFRVLDDVMHREDVTVTGKKEELDSLFVKKPIHTQDHF